jgi:hypothetical protein
MVDIQSIAGSSRPSHHEQGTEQVATSYSRVRRSHQMNTRGTTTAAAHRQHSAATMVVPPPGAGPEATPEVVCQLLHNPPGPHTSPPTAEQWSRDIDQLIIAAINMPTLR